jgi:hypothetical protein
MKDFFSKLINKVWSFIIIMSVLFGFYAYFHEKKPDMQFTVLSDPNVFDRYRSVNDLEVFFQRKNVEEENLNLKVYTLRVENNGEADILKNYYDDNLPWGFSIDSGEIVSDPRIVRNNSQYLDENLKPSVKDGRVTFQKVIFERGKYIILEFLVLHKKTENPSIKPFGKIAGVDNFPVLMDLEQEKRPFFAQLLDGGLMLHIIRWIVYTVISVILLVLFVFIIDLFGKIKKIFIRKKRQKYFQKYINQDNNTVNNDPVNPDVGAFLMDLYVNNGLRGLKELRKRLKHEKQFIFDIEKDRFLERTYKILDEKSINHHPVTMSVEWLDPVSFNEILLKRLVVVSGNSKVLDPKLKSELNRVIPFLNKFDK